MRPLQIEICASEAGSLPALRIRADDGAEATVTLYGAHLVSWKSADGKERIFCSAKSAMDGSAAIRGGVPVIFPQFATRGDGMRHGFARVSTWRANGATLELNETDLAAEMAAAWPHRFALALRVDLGGSVLRLTLDVRNTGATPFAFSSALHTYWLVDAIDEVRIDGVQDGELALPDKHDQIYFGIDAPLILRAGAETLVLEQEGFTDAVVWNPGAQDTRALKDMEDEEYRRFVCIEPALIEPHTLAPGAAWRGKHRVTA